MLEFEEWLEKADINYPYTKSDLKRAYYADREIMNPDNAKMIKDSQQISIVGIANALRKLKK